MDRLSTLFIQSYPDKFPPIITPLLSLPFKLHKRFNHSIENEHGRSLSSCLESQPYTETVVARDFIFETKTDGFILYNYMADRTGPWS